MNKKIGKMFGVSGVFAPAIAVMCLAGAPAQASTVSYFLDQSNVLSDGPAYLKVTIADGDAGAINFTVQALGAVFEAADETFGIQSFAFNVLNGSDADSASVGNLPEGWTVRDQYRMDTFGLFDIKLYGGGSSTLDTLNFSILGIEGDTPSDYANLSTGSAVDGHQFFAARVADILSEECGAKCDKVIVSGSVIASAVPAPAAAWLFGTGLVGLIAKARRRKV